MEQRGRSSAPLAPPAGRQILLQRFCCSRRWTTNAFLLKQKLHLSKKAPRKCHFFGGERTRTVTRGVYSTYRQFLHRYHEDPESFFLFIDESLRLPPQRSNLTPVGPQRAPTPGPNPPWLRFPPCQRCRQAAGSV